MYKFIILIALFSQSLYAGVGGIEGGSVHFQKDSTWVNMVYSRTLCYKEKAYFAKSKKCKKWDRDSDDRRCVKSKIETIIQPMHSTRQRCKKQEDDKCVLWETVPFTQKRDRIVKFKDEDGNILKVENLRVKKCN